MQVEFFKSIIHSVASLTYNEAQIMIDDPNMQDVRYIFTYTLHIYILLLELRTT
jgi:exoribonuclease R